jgi:hypothetical protein
VGHRNNTLYILEDDPPGDRRRWYCHEHPSGFDDVDEAVAWALSRAETAIVRTLEPAFYYAGAVPADPEDATDARPWPPSLAERAEIDAAFEKAVLSAEQEKAAWLAYREARDVWLMRTAPGLAGTEPEHRSYIDTPDGASIEFEEFAGGSLCAGRRVASGRVAFGAAVDVLAGTAVRPASDPWLLAVIAALERERSWPGRRQFLEVRLDSGELFHVTAARNRNSIQRHGLDWTQMRRRGIAGSIEPELEAVFLCDSLEDAEFFTWMGTELLDIWGVRVDGLVVESGPDGWWIVNERIPSSRLRLAVSDLVPEPPEPSSHEEASWSGYMRVRRDEPDA